MINYQIQAKIS